MSPLRNALKYIIPFLLAVIIVWLVLSKVNVSSLVTRISAANFGWVAIAILISLLAHVGRAYRWNLLLEPLGYNPPLLKTFAAVMVGYFGNIFLPRGGEVMRCMVLSKVNRVPFNASFGTVVAERGFDFICLLVLMAISLLLEYQIFKDLFQQFILSKPEGPSSKTLLSNNIFIGLLIFSLLVIIAFFIYRKKVLGSGIYLSIKKFAIGLLQGLLSILHMKNKTLFLVHTVLIWAGYYLMTYLMFFSLPSTSHLGPIAGLVILIVGGLGMSAPVSGGIGPFHIMVAGALGLFYSISNDDGLAYAFVIHTSQMISVIIVGGISSLYVLAAGRDDKKLSPDEK